MEWSGTTNLGVVGAVAPVLRLLLILLPGSLSRYYIPLVVLLTLLAGIGIGDRWPRLLALLHLLVVVVVFIDIGILVVLICIESKVNITGGLCLDGSICWCSRHCRRLAKSHSHCCTLSRSRSDPIRIIF